MLSEWYHICVSATDSKKQLLKAISLNTIELNFGIEPSNLYKYLGLDVSGFLCLG